MNTVICIVPVAPMRKEAAHRSELVSQLLFGECAEVLEKTDDFWKVRCAFDGYEGWCQRTQLQSLDVSALPAPIGFCAAYSNPVLLQGARAYLPFGSPVYSAEQSALLFGERFVDYSSANSSLLLQEPDFSETRLRHLARCFLNTAYLWGGKSVFGIDCSGFSQQVFKLLGIELLRDAYLQAEQGIPVEELATAIAGDLAFFDNDAGRITHVGILLSAQEIIHASGKVRIDRIAADGIYDEKEQKTHKLHSIRRMFAPKKDT